VAEEITVLPPDTVVVGLVAAVGLRPLDVGPLAMARTLEHMGLLNVSLNARFGWPWRSGWKLLGPPLTAAYARLTSGVTPEDAQSFGAIS
jgi:hypothetical protein